MDQVVLFAALSIPVIYISKKSLTEPASHGFTRFFSWECIIILFVSVYRFWFKNPFSATQIISWILLMSSLYPLIAGIILLRKARRPGIHRVDDKLYRFEKTTELVTTGIFRQIRHPMYSSLLLLTWGIYFKHPTLILTLVAAVSSLLLYFTALRDEKECISFFGERYKDYMKRTKRFIPFVI